MKHDTQISMNSFRKSREMADSGSDLRRGDATQVLLVVPPSGGPFRLKPGLPTILFRLKPDDERASGLPAASGVWYLGRPFRRVENLRAPALAGHSAGSHVRGGL